MTSRLTVGTERIPAKPPRGQPPCTEPVLYGSNILRDPGAERQLSNFSGGPGGDEIPIYSTYLGDYVDLYWLDDSVGPADTYFAQYDFNDDTRQWYVSSTEQRSGSYCLQNTAHETGGSSSSVVFCTFKRCGWTSGSALTPGWFTAVVEPGDYIYASVWCKILDTVLVPLKGEMFLNFHFFDSTGSYYGANFANLSNIEMTPTYAQLSGSMFAPPSAAFVRVGIDNSATGAGNGQGRVFADDFTVQVSK